MLSFKKIYQFLGSLIAIRWLCATYIIAFLPIALRLFMKVAVDEPLKSFNWFATTDIYLFSLIIFLSISNELKHVISSEVEIEKKIGYCCDIFIVALAILLGLAFLNDAKSVMNINFLLILAILMAIVSSIFGIGSLYLIDEKTRESAGEKA